MGVIIRYYDGMNVFLTSSAHRVVADIAENLGHEQVNGQKLCFITTAAEAETGDRLWMQEDRQALVDVGFQVDDWTFSGKDAPQVRAELAEFDVLFMEGGNTFFLLQEMQKSGGLEVVRSLVQDGAKTYIGSSAGSIITGPTIAPAKRLDPPEVAPDLRGHAGLSFVDFVVLPHWGSKYFKDLYLNHRLEHAYTTHNPPLVTLNDWQYVSVCNEAVTFHTTV